MLMAPYDYCMEGLESYRIVESPWIHFMLSRYSQSRNACPRSIAGKGECDFIEGISGIKCIVVYNNSKY